MCADFRPKPSWASQAEGIITDTEPHILPSTKQLIEDSLNYHQLKVISTIKKELQLSHQELASAKDNAKHHKQDSEEVMARLEKERK